MAVALGKRYRDETTGVEVLCIKPGDCNINVNGRGMEELLPKREQERTRAAEAGIDEAERPAMLRIVAPTITRPLGLCYAADQPLAGPAALVADLMVAEVRRLVECGAWGNAVLIEP